MILGVGMDWIRAGCSLQEAQRDAELARTMGRGSGSTGCPNLGKSGHGLMESQNGLGWKEI